MVSPGNLDYAHTGEGPLAFCSGGDQEVRGKGGYVGADGVPRLNVLDLQARPPATQVTPHRWRTLGVGSSARMRNT